MNLCQPIQTALERYVPDVPKDIVWGSVKSVGYSFTVSIILTQGKYEAGLESAGLSALAVIIYAVIIVVMRQLSIKESGEPFFLSLFSLHVINKKAERHPSFTATFFATAIPNLLKKPMTQTPLFGIIVV